MDILDNISCDKALDQFIHFIQNESSLNQDKFKSFDRKDKRLDHFYFHVLGIQKYKELAYTVKIILTLRHGPAAVEKGFSVGKSIFNVNMVSPFCETTHNFQISRQLITSCNSAYSKYKDSLIAARKC